MATVRPPPSRTRWFAIPRSSPCATVSRPRSSRASRRTRSGSPSRSGTASGSSSTSSMHLGSLERPLSDEAITEKFRRQAEPVVGPTRRRERSRPDGVSPKRRTRARSRASAPPEPGGGHGGPTPDDRHPRRRRHRPRDRAGGRRSRARGCRAHRPSYRLASHADRPALPRHEWLHHAGRNAGALSKLDGFILGPIGHQAYPKGPGAINPHPILRKHFDLFANVRPTRSFPGLGAIYDDVDLVIVRENNEGFQPDRNVVAGSGEVSPDGGYDDLRPA